MRHAVLGGGKRLRPALVLAAHAAVGGDADTRPLALEAAATVELVHAYSLVHDDLPAMDNADTRHGLPAVHRAFGEATAILAGDALLALAFEWLASAPWPDAAVGLRAVRELAAGAGHAGMVGGQQLDLDQTGPDTIASETEVRTLHAMKTGALFRAAVVLGGLAGGATEDHLEALAAFARPFGLAFQAIDDVLDVVGDASVLGKAVGADRDAGKTTFVDLYGVDGARQRAREAVEDALACLRPFGERAAALAALARFVVDRDR
ncbi:MAG: polyprenyl synthetase family protein [Clostridia bacterium]|nr:polyprenyl synthetase family protein [Clostridia bacterium]